MDFECGEAVMGSTHLEINRWLEELFPGLPEDTAFRYEHPALAPSGGTGTGAGIAAALGQEPPRRRKDQPLLLDNLSQFRFYSAWRGAVERRREAG